MIRLATDVGGTFTDLIVMDDAGEIATGPDPLVPWTLVEGVSRVADSPTAPPKE